MCPSDTYVSNFWFRDGGDLCCGHTLECLDADLSSSSDQDAGEDDSQTDLFPGFGD